MTGEDRPAFRVLGEPGARLTPRGCAMVVTALQLAARQAGAAGVNYKGRDRYSDFEWLLEVCRAGAAASADAASGNGARPFRLDLPGSDAIVSTAQAAVILRCKPRAVVAAIERGDLPATRVGRRAWALAEVDVRQYAGRNGRRHAPADADDRPAGGAAG